MTQSTENGTGLHIAARRHLGVSFKHRGRDPQQGIDCVGLAVLAAQECGWTVQDLPVYGRLPKAGLLDETLTQNMGAPVALYPKSFDQLQPDDIVSIRFGSCEGNRHVGIVAAHPYRPGALSLIHTDALIGRVVEQTIDQHVLARIAAVYRRVA